MVLLHVFNFTGLLSPLPSRLSATVLSVWATEYLAIISVNLFVLISGYFLCTRSFKWQKLVLLALEVIFWSWFIAGLFLLAGYRPELKQLLRSLFPISLGTYWFVTAYLGMYMLSPFLNVFIKSASGKQLLGWICKTFGPPTARLVLFFN